MRDKNTGEKGIGFIDKTGKIVIGFDRLPKTTIAVGEFYEGRAVIYLNEKAGESTGNMNYSVGYIDETGKVVIAPRFQFARDFSEGLAYAEAEGFSGFIDREGRAVIKIDDSLRANDFHEGLAAVGSKERWKEQTWHYIDRSGNVVIKKQCQFADDFSDGLAGVAVDGKYGFINKKGEMVIPPRFRLRREGGHSILIISSGRFSEGLACVNVIDPSQGVSGLYGYINKRGEFVIPPQFSYAQDFSEELAWVVTGGRSGVAPKVGWIDKAGRWVVTRVNGREFSVKPNINDYTSYSFDWRYSEGRVPFFVHIGNNILWGYMDRKGKVVIKPILVYYEAKRVWAAGLGPEGKVVIEPRPHNVGPFIGGIARVDFDSLNEKVYGYIDRLGRFIWQSK